MGGIEDAISLGAAVAWLMVNRPNNIACSISSITGKDAIRFHPPTVPVKGWCAEGVVDPFTCVEVFHLHCHFDASSEAAALELLASTKKAITSAGGTPLHSHVWHGKNGPHDPWSWEIWVENKNLIREIFSHRKNMVFLGFSDLFWLIVN